MKRVSRSNQHIAGCCTTFASVYTDASCRRLLPLKPCLRYTYHARPKETEKFSSLFTCRVPLFFTGCLPARSLPASCINIISLASLTTMLDASHTRFTVMVFVVTVLTSLFGLVQAVRIWDPISPCVDLEVMFQSNTAKLPPLGPIFPCLLHHHSYPYN
jgi:hypothetical protein